MMNITTMPDPTNAARQVAVFRDWQAASVHLRNHLLAAPECHAWAIVIPEYLEVLDPENAKLRWQFGEQAEQTQGASAQRLYDLYAGAIREDAREASRLGWHQSRAGTTVAIGTSGVFMVVEAELKTAFLPGQGDPECVDHSQAEGTPRKDASPKTRRMRSGRPECTTVGSCREGVRQSARRKGWSHIESLYYLVFKPAVQHIRKTHYDCLDMWGEPVRSDYGLLKQVLPPMSRLRFPYWMELRGSCEKA